MCLLIELDQHQQYVMEQLQQLEYAHMMADDMVTIVAMYDPCGSFSGIHRCLTHAVCTGVWSSPSGIRRADRDALAFAWPEQSGMESEAASSGKVLPAIPT